MLSTFSGLNTVVRGLFAQQAALNTVGHNIANASTEGYSRQRVNLTATTPEVMYAQSGALQVGSGVDIQSITRVRDGFMDKQMWKEASTLGYGQVSEDVYSKIEDVFYDDPDSMGLQTVMNNFYDAWNSLVTNGSNNSARTVVLERGQELADSIHQAEDRLKNIVSNVNSTLGTEVEDINQKTSQIFSLNRQISNIEADGRSQANDLRDKRDLLIDNLAKMVDVNVFEDSNHNYVVQSSGITLVDGGGSTSLRLNDPKTSTDADYGYEVRSLVVADTGAKINFVNGELKAYQEANTKTAKEYLDKLTTMSQFLLQTFNAVHRAGYGTDNSTGTNFFGDTATDYGALPLSAMSKGDWLKALEVNPDLFNADGLSKIAAKTGEVKKVTQSNTTAGAATVTGPFTAPNRNIQTFQITAGTLTAGQVDDIQYRVQDGTGAWSTPVTLTRDADGTFHLPYGLKIAITNDTDTKSGDTYTFTVPQDNASGDNATLLKNALKSPSATGSLLQGSSLDDYYQSTVAALGVQAQAKQSLTDNQQTIVEQIQNWRDSVAGVNTDDELTNMIRFQKGYSAAARVLTSMDEMLDKLINGTGVVGR